MSRTSMVLVLLASSLFPAAGHAQEEVPPPPPAPAWTQPVPIWGPPAPAWTVPDYAAPMWTPHEPVAPKRTNWAVVAPGMGLLIGGWVASWLGALTWNLMNVECTSSPSCRYNGRGPNGIDVAYSFIPLAGPWLMLTSSTMQNEEFLFPIVGGLAQAAGLITLIAGLTMPVRRSPVQLNTSASASGAMVDLSVRLD